MSRFLQSVISVALNKEGYLNAERGLFYAILKTARDSMVITGVECKEFIKNAISAFKEEPQHEAYVFYTELQKVTRFVRDFK